MNAINILTIKPLYDIIKNSGYVYIYLGFTGYHYLTCQISY